jgi:predicted HicB family RNase H-like nuclease
MSEENYQPVKIKGSTHKILKIAAAEEGTNLQTLANEWLEEKAKEHEKKKNTKKNA